MPFADNSTVRPRARYELKRRYFHRGYLWPWILVIIVPFVLRFVMFYDVTFPFQSSPSSTPVGVRPKELQLYKQPRDNLDSSLPSPRDGDLELPVIHDNRPVIRPDEDPWITHDEWIDHHSKDPMKKTDIQRSKGRDQSVTIRPYGQDLEDAEDFLMPEENEEDIIEVGGAESQLREIGERIKAVKNFHGQKDNAEEMRELSRLKNGEDERLAEEQERADDDQRQIGIFEQDIDEKKTLEEDEAEAETTPAEDYEDRVAEEKRATAEEMEVDEEMVAEEKEANKNRSPEEMEAEERRVAEELETAEEKQVAEVKEADEERRVAEELEAAEENQVEEVKEADEERRAAEERETEEEMMAAKEREADEQTRAVAAEDKEADEERRAAEEREAEEEMMAAKEREASEQTRAAVAEEKGADEKTRAAEEREAEEETMAAKEREADERRRAAVGREVEEAKKAAQEREADEEKETTEQRKAAQEKQAAEEVRKADEQGETGGEEGEAEKTAAHKTEADETTNHEGQKQYKVEEKNFNEEEQKTANDQNEGAGALKLEESTDDSKHNEDQNQVEEKEKGEEKHEDSDGENITSLNDQTEGESLAARECDLFDGDWEFDPEGPLYTNSTCFYIRGDHNCMSNGRPDTGYQNWKWKPQGCELPRFDARAFMEAFRGKTIGFVGDSLARNQMQSLLCMLSLVEIPIALHEDASSARWLYEQHKVTLVAVWSPYLLKESQEGILGFEKGQSILYLDVLDPVWTSTVPDLDIIVFSVGQWFFKPSVFILRDEIIGCHYCPNLNLTEIGFFQAYSEGLRHTLEHVAAGNWKGTAIVSTFAISHGERGTGEEGDHCGRQRPLEREEFESSFRGIQNEMRDIVWGEFNRMMVNDESNLNNNDVHIDFLDVTKLSMLRADGHPGRFYYPYPFEGKIPDEWAFDDCLHWCLPGPVDTWNQLLVQIVHKYL